MYILSSVFGIWIGLFTYILGNLLSLSGAVGGNLTIHNSSFSDFIVDLNINKIVVILFMWRHLPFLVLWA